MTEATATVTVRCSSPEQALLVHQSIQADDDEFCQTRVAGETVVATLRGPDARSLLRAADDFLACLTVGEDVIRNR